MTTKKARFLILRGGAIGDFILTLPAIQALRTRWPDAYIELIGYPHIANLALAAGLVDRVDSLDRAEMARFFSPKPSFSEQQAEYIESFDLIVSYLHDPGGCVKENLLMAGARQVIYGSPLVESGHAIDHLMKPLESLAIYNENACPQLTFNESLRKQGRQWLADHGITADPVAIHPGSGSPKKIWPLDRFLALAGRLVQAGHTPVFIAGEADSNLTPGIRARFSDSPLLEGYGLVELASILSCMPRYVGNDSGITHLAAALGIAVVVLFGRSNPERWGPRGPNVSILQAPDGNLARLDVDQVWRALFPA